MFVIIFDSNRSKYKSGANYFNYLFVIDELCGF